jgi:hypothetical protein
MGYLAGGWRRVETARGSTVIGTTSSHLFWEC